MRAHESGQSTAEYVAVVTVVAVVLALAATLAAAPNLAAALVRHVRVALCIAGGDVCRAADARARGLEPCRTRSTERARDTSVTIGPWRTGHGRTYLVARRSDGTVVVSGTDGGRVSRSYGLGIHFSPHAVGETGVSAGVFFERGREWVFDDWTRARRFLTRVDDVMHLSDDGDVYRATRLPAPTRYLEGGGRLGVQLAAELRSRRASTAVTAADAELRAALGRRVAPEGTTLYYDASAELGGELARVVPALGAFRDVVLEWRDGRPAVVTLRTSVGDGSARTTETTARLALEAPGDRDAALAVALAPLAGPAAGLAARDFLRRVREHGTIERQAFAEEVDGAGFDVAAEAGPVGGVGVDHTSTTTRRRLVAAEVLAGGRSARRIDCLGLGRLGRS